MSISGSSANAARFPSLRKRQITPPAKACSKFAFFSHGVGVNKIRDRVEAAERDTAMAIDHDALGGCGLGPKRKWLTTAKGSRTRTEKELSSGLMRPS